MLKTRMKNNEMKKSLYNLLAIALVHGLPMLAFLMLVSCQTEQPTTEIYESVERKGELMAEWNDIYETMDTEYDFSVDMEVGALREKLEPHGITVMRVNPNNVEHQRRYRRHLLNQSNPQMEMTDWQIHKVHSFPSNGRTYDKDCPHCKKEMVEFMNVGIQEFRERQRLGL